MTLTNKIAMTVLLIALAFTGVSCQKDVNPENGGESTLDFDPFAGWRLDEFDGTVESFKAPKPPFDYTLTYQYEKAEFCSPERGSYEQMEYHSRTAMSLSPSLWHDSRLAAVSTAPCIISESISATICVATFRKRLSPCSVPISNVNVRPDAKSYCATLTRGVTRPR